jgi:hypothetical protein
MPSHGGGHIQVIKQWKANNMQEPGQTKMVEWLENMLARLRGDEGAEVLELKGKVMIQIGCSEASDGCEILADLEE